MTITQAQMAKANMALDTQVRVNGKEFMTRRVLIESRVEAGARIIEREGERVLMSPDGAWFDIRNITKAGLDYAEKLIAIKQAPYGEWCRDPQICAGILST